MIYRNIHFHGIGFYNRAACGQYVVATYYNDGQNINIYLEFKPPVKSDVHVVTIPVADTLEERRHEKATSW